MKRRDYCNLADAETFEGLADRVSRIEEIRRILSSFCLPSCAQYSTAGSTVQREIAFDQLDQIFVSSIFSFIYNCCFSLHFYVTAGDTTIIPRHSKHIKDFSAGKVGFFLLRLGLPTPKRVILCLLDALVLRMRQFI